MPSTNSLFTLPHPEQKLTRSTCQTQRPRQIELTAKIIITAGVWQANISLLGLTIGLIMLCSHLIPYSVVQPRARLVVSRSNYSQLPDATKYVTKWLDGTNTPRWLKYTLFLIALIIVGLVLVSQLWSSTVLAACGVGPKAVDYGPITPHTSKLF